MTSFHTMMGTVGNLRPEEQANYNNQQIRRTRAKAANYDIPDSMKGTSQESSLDWWNTDFRKSTQKSKAPQRSSKDRNAPQKAKKSHNDESSTSYKIKVPLVNLERPSPYIWTVGMAIVSTLILAGELYQMGFQNIDFKENPMCGPSTEVLLMLGAKYQPMIIDGDWWRIFTPVFLPSGIIIWAVSLILLIITKSIERETGFYRAMLTYMVCGVFGYILSCIFIPRAVTTGATASLIGLMGVMLCDLFATWKIKNHQIPRLIGIILVIIILFIAGLTPYIDNFAHLGGLIMGLLVALMLVPNLNYGKCQAYCYGVISFFAFPIMSTLFMVCFVIVFKSIDANLDWCKNCERFNCVEFVSGWCDQLQY